MVCVSRYYSIFWFFLCAYFQDITLGSMSMEIQEINGYKTVHESETVNSNPISCYECNTIHDGELCWNLGKNTSNLQDFAHKERSCPAEQPYCKVYRVEYLVLEDFKSDDSGPYTKWSMERNCSSECKNFCVTMGGRTKITYCTSCCTSDLCNVDNSVNKIKINSIFFVVTSFIGIIKSLNTF